MKSAKEIDAQKRFIRIVTTEDEEFICNYEGQFGKYLRQEVRSKFFVFDRESQDAILDAIDRVYEEPFFRDQIYVNELAKFQLLDSNDDGPIMISSRKIIQDGIELIRFLYGNEKNTCVAIRLSDGTVLTPTDWNTRKWDSDDWTVYDCTWRDSNNNEVAIPKGISKIKQYINL